MGKKRWSLFFSSGLIGSYWCLALACRTKPNRINDIIHKTVG
jgi:hypothetical protein